MRRAVILLVIVALLVSLVYWESRKHKIQTSGTEGGVSQSTTEGRVSQSTPRGLPADYFPFTTGLRLEYLITLGATEPLNFETVEWPTGDNHATLQETRGRFVPAIDKKSGQTYSLILEIEGPAAHRGPYAWDGVKVKVVKDELGVFENVQELFWNRTSGGDFMVQEVRTHSPDSPGAPTGPWGTWNADNGTSTRIVFFGGAPGTARSIGSRDEDSNDELDFLGLDGDRLHFVRSVKAAKSDSSDSQGADSLNHAFEEHTWFEYGRGMVRLEQRIDGAVSMTWELVGSSIAPAPAQTSAQ
jgi:hypothetical protein